MSIPHKCKITNSLKAHAQRAIPFFNTHMSYVDDGAIGFEAGRSSTGNAIHRRDLNRETTHKMKCQTRGRDRQI